MAATGWGVIRPGESLTSADVARRCQLSVAEVESVVPDLERDGLISVAGQTLHVTSTTRGSLHELVQLRALIETQLACRAADRGPSRTDGAELLRLADATRESAAQGDELDYIQADLAFHLFLSSLGGDAESVELVRVLRIRNRIGGLHEDDHRSFMAANGEEHVAIATAVVEGRAVDVARLVRRHVTQIHDDWFETGPRPTSSAPRDRGHDS